MKCNGIDVATGERSEVSFAEYITGVDPLLSEQGDPAYLAPGWIDLQVNGFAGVDYNDGSTRHEEIAGSIRAMFRTGVTRFFPTVITGSPEGMLSALRNLAGAREALPEGHAMEAFHVEGPYISAEDGPRGAHPAAWVRPPDLNEFHRFQDAAGGNIRLITLSPEWPQAPRFIEAVVQEGVVASIGHCWGISRRDRSRGQRGRNAFDAPRKRGPRGAASPPELYLGSARRRSAGSQLYRRWNPPGPVIFEDSVARQGIGARPFGH